MDIPKWLTSYISDEGIADIEIAVRNAELETSGEIVPMVVRRSSKIGSASMIVFMLVTILLVITRDYYWPDHWDETFQLLLILGLLQISLSAAMLTKRIDWLQRLVIPKADQVQSVNERAEREFYTHQIHGTEMATGVLIMVSLMEHRAVILADESINSKVDPKVWQEILDELLKEIKRNQMAKGFSGAVANIGKTLSQHFPIQPDDVNELKNQLIIKD